MAKRDRFLEAACSLSTTVLWMHIQRKGALSSPNCSERGKHIMTDMGKWLILLGLVIAAVGAILTFAGKIPWFGKLPGDIYIKRESFSFYFPLATCIIISIIVSFILWLFRK
jgi:NAD/NADP transhydrogenase beta subunit